MLTTTVTIILFSYNLRNTKPLLFFFLVSHSHCFLSASNNFYLFNSPRQHSGNKQPRSTSLYRNVGPPIAPHTVLIAEGLVWSIEL